MLKDRNIDICCVTETWFKSKDGARFSEIHDFGYDVISAPRKGIGGGVAFVFNPKAITPVRNNVKSYKSFEVVECVIKTADNLIRLCVIYRSTQSKSKIKYEETKVSTFFEEFEEYLDGVMNKNGAPLLCGDFNFHVEDDNNTNATNFISLCESKGFKQNVHAPTHVSGGILDLVFTLDSVTVPDVDDRSDGNILSTGCCVADSLPISNLVVDPNTGTSSDHFLISFKLCVSSLRKGNDKIQVKELREFSKIDVEKFREDLFCSPINLADYETVDQATQLFTDVLECLLDKHAPVVTRKFNLSRSPWWDPKCQEAKCEMRKAQRLLTKDPTSEEARVNYNEKCIDKAIIIDRARNLFYDKKLCSLEGDARGTYKVINHLLDKEFGANKLPNGNSNHFLMKRSKRFIKGLNNKQSNLIVLLRLCLILYLIKELLS